MLIDAGTYSSTSALSFTGVHSLIGQSTTQPVITRSTPGPIFSIGGNVDATFENVQISGATTSGTDYGDAIVCAASGGTPVLTLRNTTLKQNATTALTATGCTVTALHSTFTQNGGFGASTSNGNATFDACLVSENEAGLSLDSGLFKITNNLIVRNYSASNSTYFGLTMYSTTSGNQVEFNTIADNSNGSSTNYGGGFECNLQGTTGSFPNNIIARNKLQTVGTNCTYPSSLIVDTNIGGLNFKSPDSQPFDYHIQAGSLAIDAATASSVDHDVDGQPRPNGTVRDVGADEYVP